MTTPFRHGLYVLSFYLCLLLSSAMAAQTPNVDSLQLAMLTTILEDSLMVRAIEAYTAYDSLKHAGAYDLPADISLASWKTIREYPDLAEEIFRDAGYREWRALGEAWRVSHMYTDRFQELLAPYVEVLSVAQLNSVLRAVYAHLGVTPVGNLD